MIPLLVVRYDSSLPPAHDRRQLCPLLSAARGDFRRERLHADGGARDAGAYLTGELGLILMMFG